MEGWIWWKKDQRLKNEGYILLAPSLESPLFSNFYCRVISLFIASCTCTYFEVVQENKTENGHASFHAKPAPFYNFAKLAFLLMRYTIMHFSREGCSVLGKVRSSFFVKYYVVVIQNQD